MSYPNKMKGSSIILDKSYLQGAPGIRIKELSEQFQLLMPDVLFYELISPGEPGLSRCFNKLPQEPNPISIVKPVSALLNKELETHQPAGLPSENLEKLNYQFNPALSKGVNSDNKCNT